MTKAPESPPSMVDVRNVTMRFKSVEAVKDISLHIPKGHVLGLVGSDGAGKSTLLRLVATMIQPTSGDIYIDGLHVVTDKQKIKNIIGYMPQRFGLYQDLTVEENMDFFMDIFAVPRRERKKRKEKYLGFSNLLDRKSVV